MAYPNDFTVFQGIPPEFPETFSELTDDVFIWNSPNRTLTESIVLSDQQINNISNIIANAISGIIVNSINGRIDIHDADIKQMISNMESALRQIIGAVVKEVNENQYLLETISGDTIKVII